ncbi:hypothetical protein [Cryobacterium soli]|uniref:hypothetical protein n=1 Tax=Cryobacterium soli TaxID=2220095 RepID=UPI0013C3FF01|nr:hypothetical protein [Cryobacterium soli]
MRALWVLFLLGIFWAFVSSALVLPHLMIILPTPGLISPLMILPFIYPTESSDQP